MYKKSIKLNEFFLLFSTPFNAVQVHTSNYVWRSSRQSCPSEGWPGFPLTLADSFFNCMLFLVCNLNELDFKYGFKYGLNMGKYGYSIYMGGLSERIRTRDVEDFFRGYGKILDISLKAKFGKYDS